MTPTPITAVVEPPVIPEVVPAWAREPAKIVGWIVATVILVGAGLLEVANEVIDFLPENWKTPVRSACATVALVVLIATRVQALLTRNGLGAPGNGKDGVWSPYAVSVLAKVTAAQAATPEAIEAAIAPKLMPPPGTVTPDYPAAPEANDG